MSGVLLRILVFGFAFMFVALPVRAADDLGTLDGTWEGSLAVIGAPGFKAPGPPYVIRIVIAGTAAHVFGRYRSGDPYQEVKPGAFHVSRLGPNGVVVAMDSGNDNEGTWVETWNFTVTLKQRDTLIAVFCRTVNNLNLPLSVDHSKFTETQAGELNRAH